MSILITVGWLFKSFMTVSVPKRLCDPIQWQGFVSSATDNVLQPTSYIIHRHWESGLNCHCCCLWNCSWRQLEVALMSARYWVETLLILKKTLWHLGDWRREVVSDPVVHCPTPWGLNMGSWGLLMWSRCSAGAGEELEWNTAIYRGRLLPHVCVRGGRGRCIPDSGGLKTDELRW